MILAYSEIIKELQQDQLQITPNPEDWQIGPSSIDLCLSDQMTLLYPVIEAQQKAGVMSAIDLATFTFSEFVKQMCEALKLGADSTFEIPSGRLVLGMTREKITLPQHLGARVEGKSSLARIGLLVHLTAPTIHPGFSNQIALEFYNVGPLPIRVRPGHPICQLILERVEGTGLYHGQFQSA